MYKKLAKPFPEDSVITSTTGNQIGQAQIEPIEGKPFANQTDVGFQNSTVNTSEEPVSHCTHTTYKENSKFEETLKEVLLSDEKVGTAEDLTSVELSPQNIKYFTEYPYLPKTPVDEYQHRSDLYKELITRKQLFKMTQFVKK